MFDTGLKRIEELNMKVIRELANEFRSHESESFNPRETIYNTIMNIMTMLLINKKFQKTDKEFKLFTEIERLSISSISSSGKGIMKDIRLDDKGSNGLMHALFCLYQNQQEGKSPDTFPLEEVNLKTAFVDMIVAGTTTTSNSFYGFLNIISQHHDIQEKLQEEVDRVVGTDRMVSLTDRSTMPYTQATVLELLRLTSVVSMSVPHATMETTSVSGIPIPAGVQMLPNLWAMHHEEDFWGDPHAFRPERFLDEAGDVVSASHENRKHLMPFGAGTRVCVGEILAIGRLFLLLAMMAQLFVVEQGDVKSSWDPRSYQSGIVLYPLDYEIRLRNRNEHLHAK
ncbi:hypothetical protein CAPTEDRAFT_136624 [Capitella teleta]|uniref:Uncharacterized protein n=1 Tax=Capitella teleta TaxID=283909 RepID=R7TWR7_CAPTE|nr:hypothetical protein CAPTEDRAFT_136624 [Capitella teleta]|eukprot:ELT98194.1 hypothetical protein CAPTEDRAFT_136624 [Capitella teleta]